MGTDYLKFQYLYISQGPRIDFQSKGATIVPYLVSPVGVSMVGTEGELFAFCFSRTQENDIQEAFLRFAIVYLNMRH